MAQQQHSLMAPQLRVDPLGLSNVDISSQTTYTAKFNETLKVNRLDAEYFQPKYQRMLDLTHIPQFQPDG